ncbi:hypothetical protein LMG7974_01579 [Campylobacter majalis]|uniref:Uncharacterized protein n=1 Tax=Campylobacter majalis TaxID=2790656 RepID=A0ABM8Q9M3_9BACT|nr:hypothetical protein [Campylobacter majalis]CAD7289502.1 hypothetical protein LMG7974_01579 [Campylobacter majalis]
MKAKFFLILSILATLCNANIVSEAIDNQSVSQKSLTKTIISQNTAHQNYISLNKHILLNKYNHIFLIHQRNELILNQLKVRGVKQ